MSAQPPTPSPNAPTQVCPSCGTRVKPDATECPICGQALASTAHTQAARLAQPAATQRAGAGNDAPDAQAPAERGQTKLCPKCGARVPAETIECPHCDYVWADVERPVAATTPVTTRINRRWPIVLAAIAALAVIASAIFPRLLGTSTSTAVSVPEAAITPEIVFLTPASSSSSPTAAPDPTPTNVEAPTTPTVEPTTPTPTELPATAAPSPTVAPTQPPAQGVVVTTPITGTANVRPAPNTSGTPNGQLQNGSAVEIVCKTTGSNTGPGTTDVWFKVKTTQGEGYVYSTLVQTAAESAVPTCQ